MNARRPVISALLVGLLGLGCAAAQAQDRMDPNVTVRDRSRPEFDPLGLRAGAFLLSPSVTLEEIYDDNVFAEPDDEESDFITLIQPRVRVASDFVRHQLGLSAGADIARYIDNDDEDYEDYFAGLDGRLDVRRDTVVTGAFDIGQFHEDRDDVEDVEADEITDFLRYGGQLSVAQRFNRLNVRATGISTVFDFDDVPGENNDDRDRTEWDALLRLGYLLSPRINVFTEGRYHIEDRDQDIDDAGVERDSDGWEARVGGEIDITAVLFGEAFVGYRRESFDEESFDDVDGISFGVDLTWNPTSLTTVGLSGGSDIESTAQSGASGNFKTDVLLTVDHELLRNLLLRGTAGYERDDFDGIDRVDDTFDIGASLTYLLNRYLSVTGGYLFTDRSSDDETEEFSRNRIRLGLTAQL